MRKTLLLLTLFTLFGSHVVKAQVYVDKCVCAYLYQLQYANPELENDFTHETWSQFWDCPGNEDFEIENTMRMCMESYITSSSTVLTDIVDTATWDEQAIWNLEDVVIAYSITVTEECYNNIKCGTSPSFVNKATANKSLLFYPNPGKEKIQVIVPNSAIQSVYIIDVLGKQVEAGIDFQNGEIQLHTDKLAKGLYHCIIQTEQGAYSGIFQIQ